MRLKRLVREDEKAEDELTAPIVFLAAFLAALVLLIGYAAEFYSTTIDEGNISYGTGYNTIGGSTYEMLQPYDGYSITMENASDQWDRDHDTNLYFYEDTIDEDDHVTFAIVRNQNLALPESLIDWARYHDYFYFTIDYGWWSYKSTAISFETMATAQLGDTNQSIIDISLGKRHYTFLLQTGGDGSTFETLLYANLFNASLGLNLEDQLTHNSAMTIIGQMLTFQLPDVDPMVNYLIGVPIWTCIGIAAFLVVKELIPF